MPKIFPVSALMIVIGSWSTTAAAESLCAAPWRRLAENGREFLRPLPLALVGASAVPALTMSPTGADYEARRFVQTDLGGSYNPEPISIWAPYVFYPSSVLFYAGAAAFDFCPGQTRASAIIQGTTETILTVGLVKWVTGRRWPLGGRDPNDPEVLEHPEDGRAWAPFRAGLGAFPSGHTAFFFAAAAAFRASSPDLPILRFAGYPLAGAVGFFMWFGDHHWASDILSGALLGEAIGGAAGRSWAGDAKTSEVSFVLLPVERGALVSVAGILD